MPRLPAELWWDILRLAVHIPGLFETKWDYSPDFLIWHGWESPESSYSASLQTKSSICRVSKSWREIGLELLYEHLLFTETDIRSGVLSKVVSILEYHADRSGYGRSTKRVDVYSYLLDPPHFALLLRLLGLCHNVRIFISSNEAWVDMVLKPSELSSILQSRFSHSLRRARFSACDYNHLPPHFPDIPLDTLELSLGGILPIDLPPAITTVSTLCFDIYSEDFHFPSWRFPALRNLELRKITEDDIPSLRSFMAIHGPQLHSLHLSVWSRVQEKLTLLSELLAPATNLRCLALDPRDIGSWPPSHDSFPSITHIASHSTSLSDMEHIISGSTFPGLRCIRFLDYFNSLTVLNPDQKDEWMSFLKLGSKRNIRFEDNKAQLIQI